LAILYNPYSGVNIKDRKKGEACGTYEGKERCIKGFGGET
jgi:hypothetical protein